MQRSDGVFGALTVRKCKYNDPNGYLYDYNLPEHSMVVSDWISKNVMDTYEPGPIGITPEADSILMNGHGYTSGYDGGTSEVFCVQPGKSYVINAVNAGSNNCPCQITVCILENMHFEQEISFYK